MPRAIGEIEQGLRDGQAEIELLVQQAAQLQSETLGMAVGLAQGGAEALNKLGHGYFAACEEKGDCRPFGWGHPAWNEYRPLDSDVLDEVRIGGYAETDLLPGEESFDFPITTALFSTNGPLIIAHDGSRAEEARQMFQSLLLRVALVSPGQVRFTLIDPTGMGAAYPFRGFLGRDVVRSTGRSPMDELGEVLEDIRRINERVIAEAPRFSALSTEQRAGESFELVAVADFPKAYAKDPRALEALTTIANAGPRAGRHLIIEWDRSQKPPHGFDAEEMKGPVVFDLDARNMRIDGPPDASRQRGLIDRAYASARRRGGGDWNSAVRPDALLQESSKNRIVTPVGERLNFWLGEAEDGKPSAHAMIAGQTGSGKSYLLHVIISGLAARYSPEELQFTLIDGKQGVEFEAYRTLPHADIVSLRTAPALARSVLADFVAEMEDRYELFQDANVVKLADYRAKTGGIMPRRLLVIDEYQQVLEGDSEAGAALLGRLLEKGRAAGMHAILGSQTFEQRGLPHSSLTHIHTWASLSLTENYAQGLQVFGSEGKRLIRDLAATGEVVLNDEGGRDGANSRGAVARLRKKSGEELLPGIIAEINEAASGGALPIVLSGREGALAADNPHLARQADAYPQPEELQEIARKPTRAGGYGVEAWNTGDRPIPLWLGRKFDVRDHALCVLRRAPAQNLLVLGSQAEARHRMLAFALAGIGASLPPQSVTFSFIDGLRADMPGGGMIRAGLARLEQDGFAVEQVAEQALDAHLAALAARTETPDPQAASHILVISDPDYLYDLHGGADRFSAPTSGPAVALRKLLTRGPQNGIHTIFTLSGLSNFQLILSPSREAPLFNHKVVQQMNEEESMSLFSSLLAARLRERAEHPNAALCVDQIAGPRSAALFHSYCANRALGGDQGLVALEGELARIRYPGPRADVA